MNLDKTHCCVTRSPSWWKGQINSVLINKPVCLTKLKLHVNISDVNEIPLMPILLHKTLMSLAWKIVPPGYFNHGIIITWSEKCSWCLMMFMTLTSNESRRNSAKTKVKTPDYCTLYQKVCVLQNVSHLSICWFCLQYWG